MAEPETSIPDPTVKKAAETGASKTLGQSAEQSRADYNGGGEPGGSNAGDRPLGRKDPMTTGQNAPNDHNVPTR